MTGVVHVLKLSEKLPYDQDFYDRQAADQRRDLLSDRDGRSVAACGECAAQDSLKARVVTAGTGEISATAGGTDTLSVMRFLPHQINIRVGDTVEWTNQSPVEPHTVTFGTPPNEFPMAIFGAIFFPFNLRGSAAPPPPQPPPPQISNLDSDGALHADIPAQNDAAFPNTDSVSSGLLAAPAQYQIGSLQALGVTRFRVTFHKVGAFPYYCILHDDIGMNGIVLVFPTPPPPHP